MKNNLFSKFENSVTYRDFKRLWQFRKNIESFDHPAGLTFSDNSFLRYVSFSALYFAQGIPQGFLYFALPAWMALNGFTPIEIGKYMAVAFLPWSFKIVAAPVMDRFSFLAMGRRRPWLIAGQFGIVVGMIFMSGMQNPAENLMMLMVLGFCINLFTILQDIATDGLAIDVLPEHQQARANGLMWGSKSIGVAATVAVTTWFFRVFGFSTTLILFALLVVIIMIFPILIKERPGEKRLPWTKGAVSPEVLSLHLPNWILIVKRLFSVFFLPASILMGIGSFSYALAEGLTDAALPILALQKLGWTDDQYSTILSSAQLTGGLLGMFLGGALIDIFGKKKMLFIYLLALVLVFGTFSLLNAQWDNRLFLSVFIVMYGILSTFVSISIFAIAMQLCWKQVAATQFTLYMAILNFGMSSGSYLMGQFEQIMEWKHIFLVNILFLAVAMGVIYFIDFDKHTNRMVARMNLSADLKISSSRESSG